jgi:hypothetical protein
MATSSWPAVGDGGLSDDQWLSGYAAEDGIINDFHTSGTAACSLTVNSTTNEVTISPGQVRVSGYTLDVESNTVLSCPTVGSTTTYSIVAQYDPALNVADGSGDADPLGPVRLIITNTAVSTSGGKHNYTLYTGVRTVGQALSAVSWTDHRKWIGPVMVGPNSTLNLTLTPVARGTLLIQTDAASTTDLVNISVRTVNAGGTALEWQSLLCPPPVAFPVRATLVANESTTPPEMVREGSWVNLRGTIRRSGGGNLNNGAPVILGDLPVGWRPTTGRRIACMGSGPNFLAVNVGSDGIVSMYDPPVNVTFIQLDGIRFRVQ